MGLGLVTVLRTDNVAGYQSFHCDTDNHSKIEQIGIFASHKPCKMKPVQRFYVTIDSNNHMKQP